MKEQKDNFWRVRELGGVKERKSERLQNKHACELCSSSNGWSLLICLKKTASTSFYNCNYNFFQILRDWQLQSWCDWRQQAEGGDPSRGGRHLEVQERQPNHVRVGDQGQAPGWGHLQPGQRAQCQLHQQVIYNSKLCLVFVGSRKYKQQEIFDF